MVSIAMIFTQMMEPNFGIFNTLLTYLNLPTSKWLQSSDTAMSSVLVISIWKHIGYYVLIFIAAFQSIPTSITEAASLDNAGRAKTLFKIMIPMISPQIFFVLIILTINSFKVFDTIRLTTMGGPNNATTSIVYYIYQQYDKICDEYHLTDEDLGRIQNVVIGNTSEEAQKELLETRTASLKEELAVYKEKYGKKHDPLKAIMKAYGLVENQIDEVQPVIDFYESLDEVFGEMDNLT